MAIADLTVAVHDRIMQSPVVWCWPRLTAMAGLLSLNSHVLGKA